MPVLGSAQERAGLGRLRTEARVFASGMREAVARNPEGRTNARQFFNTAVLPKRASFLEATENLQAVNRAGFIEYQSELAGYTARPSDDVAAICVGHLLQPGYRDRCPSVLGPPGKSAGLAAPKRRAQRAVAARSVHQAHHRAGGRATTYRARAAR